MPAIGIMNLLTRLGPMLGLTGKATSRIGEKVFKGRPIWQRAKPAQKAKREFGVPKRTDPDYKGEGKKFLGILVHNQKFLRAFLIDCI